MYGPPESRWRSTNLPLHPNIKTLDANAKTAAVAAERWAVRLARYPVICVAAGTPDPVMPMTYDQLVSITEGVVMGVR